MDREVKWGAGIFSILLLLTTLACGLGGLGLPEVDAPAGAAATAQGAAASAATAVAQVTVPAGVAETAQAAAGDSNGLVATAKALAGDRGGNLLATLESSDFDVSVTVDMEALRQKAANAQPDADGNITINLTDEELNQAITLRAGRAGEAPALQDPDLTFTDGNVVMVAQVQQPVQGELRAAFQPVVSDGQLRLFLTSVNVGGIPVPTALLASVEATINSSLATALVVIPNNYSLREVTVGGGTLTIVARRN